MPVSRQKAEDPCEIGASPPLNGHTLEHTIRRYRDYHKVCVLSRKNGVSFEINRERQRTEMLNRKYCDNLRQQQALSGRIEAKDQQNGSTPFEADATIFVSRACVHVYIHVHVRTCIYMYVSTMYTSVRTSRYIAFSRRFVCGG